MKKSSEIKLVVVDDAVFIREVVRHIIQNSKEIQLVGEASDGEEAVELLKSIEVEVVLMDIVMPKKNGIDATREILEFKPELKIIACSTVDHESMIMKALDAGCCSYLTKPFEAKQLTNLIYETYKGAQK